MGTTFSTVADLGAPANAGSCEERLMGFELSTFCMASSRWVRQEPAKCLQRTTSDSPDRRLAFRELCGDTGGLDKERTMSDY
jgi:hypothetical protein